MICYNLIVSIPNNILKDHQKKSVIVEFYINKSVYNEDKFFTQTLMEANTPFTSVSKKVICYMNFIMF